MKNKRNEKEKRKSEKIYTRGPNGDLKENFSAMQSSAAGISAAVDSFLLVIAVIFFLMEFLLLFYSISLALKCTSPGPERILHLTLAIAFTLPYALFSAFFSKCSQDTLRGNDIFLAPKAGARPPGAAGNNLSFI